MNSQQRNSFLSFFQNKQHTIVPAHSIVPFNDPTLIFTNAGIINLKMFFRNWTA